MDLLLSISNVVRDAFYLLMYLASVIFMMAALVCLLKKEKDFKKIMTYFVVAFVLSYMSDFYFLQKDIKTTKDAVQVLLLKK